MKTFIAVSVLVFASISQAAGNYICQCPQLGLTAKVVVQGAGTNATVAIEDSTMAGTFIYFNTPTQPMPGYLTFVGTFINKLENPPGQHKGAFMIQPALVNGNPTGNFLRFTGEAWATFVCNQVR